MFFRANGEFARDESAGASLSTGGALGLRPTTRRLSHECYADYCY